MAFLTFTAGFFPSVECTPRKVIRNWIMLIGKIRTEMMASMISSILIKNNKALLLGASGRLGQILSSNWPKSDDLRLQSRRPIAGGMDFDMLTQPKVLAQAASNCRAVICFSGVTPAHAKASGDAMALNVSLACAAVKVAPKGVRVFLASSAAVYGNGHEIHHEDGPCTPLSDYGRAKLEMEHQAIALGQQRGVPVTALRIANVAGADAILGGWKDGMTLDQLADGTTPSRSYIGPKSLARVIYELTKTADLPEVLNITAPGTIQMGALLDAAGLAWRPRPAPAAVIPSVALSTQKLEQFVAFSPLESIADGMIDQWRDEKENR